MDGGAEVPEHRVVAPAGEAGIWAISGIFDRAADDDMIRPGVQPAAGMGDEPFEKGSAEILEAQPLAENRSMFERSAGGDRLERLDEAAALGIFEIFGDRPGACLDLDPVIFPEAQGRAEDGAGRVGRAEIDEIGGPLVQSQSDDAVGRTEIEPERLARHRRARPIRC